MLFNSLHYLAFFPLVVLAFFLLPVRFRAFLLVLASCYFYMVFKPVYILILLAVIAIDYFSGLYIERNVGSRRRLGLLLSIASNVGILFVFKYYGFARDNLTALSHSLGLPHAVIPPALKLVLPIGLSFHTFQSLAYIIEVFYGRFPAERNPVRFALYVLFFPQMVAGPIERPQGLLRQLQHLDRAFSYEHAVQGLRMILVGFWCKLLVADNLAPYVDAVYSNPSGATGFTATLATLCFAVQIYCDFFGYSQIAIGSARVLGITLAPNFNHPYRARSIADFWRRWHISLSTWFRDYLYIPLGGNRVPPLRRDGNILIVFLLSGLWHGAHWTYVVWGGLHGAYLLFENHFSRGSASPSQTRTAWLSRAGVFALVCLAWVFFRASSIADAFTLIQAIGTKWSTFGAEAEGSLARLWQFGSLQNDAAIGAIAYGVLGLVIEPLANRESPRLSRPARWGLYYGMIVGILIGAKFESRSFIYFQF